MKTGSFRKSFLVFLLFLFLISGCTTNNVTTQQPINNSVGIQEVQGLKTDDQIQQNLNVNNQVQESNLSNDNYYINSQGNKVHSPAYSNTVPEGASAICGDGTYSFSQSRRGTCSHHGGVAEWLY